jgi:putative tryptophan/tyrosine transport system substrate-binding protein
MASCWGRPGGRLDIVRGAASICRVHVAAIVAARPVVARVPAAFQRFALAVLVALPLAVDAQGARTIARIGYLNAASAPAAAQVVDAFRQGLRELGYIEGQNLSIEYRWADGRFERLPALAQELVRRGVDVIVAPNTPAALAARQATSTIPVVFVFSGDPVGSGLVHSLARPGANVTGLSLTPTDAIGGKQLELVKQVIPAVDRVAVLANPANPPTQGLLAETERAARLLGMQLHVVPVSSLDGLDAAFEAINRAGVAALSVIADPLLNQHRARIVAFAAKNRLPAIYPYSSFVEEGGLMSYGVNLLDLSRRSASYVDRILKGAKPAELPIEQPTRFEWVIHLGTAKALGLTIPQSVLLRADQVIP